MFTYLDTDEPTGLCSRCGIEGGCPCDLGVY